MQDLDNVYTGTWQILDCIRNWRVSLKSVHQRFTQQWYPHHDPCINCWCTILHLWFISCVLSKLRSSVIKYTIFKEKSGIFYFICWWNKLVIVSIHFTLKMGKSSSSLLAHQKEHFLIIFEEPSQENNIHNAVMNVKCFVCLELITFWWSTLSSQ